MSEENPIPALPPPSAPTLAPRSASRRSEDRTARTLTVLALLGTVAAVWIAIDARRAVSTMEATAGTRLGELGTESQQARAALAQSQAALKEVQARVTEIESRVADTHEQRVALEEMYRELSRSADDRVLSEVEQMLVLASQQLQLAGNVRGALAALQAADQRLARAEKLAATPLRRAITQDMDRLKAVPLVDTAGLAVKIDQVMAQTDSLPLIISETLPAARISRIRAGEEQGFTRAARDLWEEMKGLVRIRDLETQDAALLAPAQGYFLRENVKLRLLAARMALLARDESAFREDMRASQAWIARYFDAKARATQAALATLKQVAETPVTIAVPDINASLAAVRTARAARERR
jgi:uroporphyrin-III C-methyltransferase